MTIELSAVGIAGRLVERLQLFEDIRIGLSRRLGLSLEPQLDRQRLLGLSHRAQGPRDHPVRCARGLGVGAALAQRQREPELLQRLFVTAELVQCIANVVADRGFPALRGGLRRSLDDGECLLAPFELLCRASSRSCVVICSGA